MAHTTDALEAKLREIIRFVLDLPGDVDPRTASRQVTPAWDSLAHVMLMLAVESEFNVTIDVDSQIRLTSYAAIRQYLEGQGA